MKNLLLFASVLFAAFVLSGCVTANPDKSPGAPQFIPSPQITNYQAQAQAGLPVLQGILASTPAAPVAPILPTLLAGIFGLTTLISGYVAKQKSAAADTAQASSDQHSAAAAALAAVVSNSKGADGQPSPAIVALQYAAANGSTAAVATHLANAANPVQL